MKLVGKSRKTADIRAPILVITVQIEEMEMSPSASVFIVTSPTVRRHIENSDDDWSPWMCALMFGISTFGRVGTGKKT